MAILTGSDIEGAVDSSAIRIDPFSKDQIQPASYDLRVGATGITTSSSGVINIETKGYFELRPGDFGILLTREIIHFDASHTARIGLRSKYARKGVLATTGPQVDPGFRGRLKVGVTNLSPHVISFPYEDDFITLEIHSLSRPSASPYDGPYQGVEDLSPSDIEVVTEGDNIGFAKMLDSLAALSRNVNALAENVKKFTGQNETLQQQNKHTVWLIGAGVAVIALLVGLK